MNHNAFGSPAHGRIKKEKEKRKREKITILPHRFFLSGLAILRLYIDK
jgi:hypothetical protein